MGQPKKPPVSLRVPEATRGRVEKWATARGIPRNAAYVELIERGLKLVGVAPQKEPPQQAVDAANAAIRKALADPPKVDVPLAGTFARGPYQKGRKP